ncbi:MAG: protein translocase subunit SecD [Gemmatales bacterium]|nr:protein translocase subunit SecD [Gemmatales bacterium]
MLKRFFWPIIICVVPVVVSAWIVLAATLNMLDPQSEGGLRFNMGVDLAGGTILIYEVDRDWWYSRLSEAERAEFDSTRLATALKRRIDPADLQQITIRPIQTTPPRVEIILPLRAGRQQADIERVKNAIGQVGKLEFRLVADSRDRDATGREVGRQIFKAVQEAVRDWTPDERSLPPLPADYPPLPEPALLEWVELAENVVRELKKPQDGQTPVLPDGFVEAGNLAFYYANQVNRYFLLTRKPADESLAVVGEDLSAVWKGPGGRTGQLVVHFSMKPTGAEKLFALTEPVGHHMAIILDNKVFSYPVLQARLRDGGIIEMGGLTGKELRDKVEELVQVLQSGALPATLNRTPVSEMSMGPGLGQDTIRAGRNAVIISFVAVVVFMIIYYRFAGLVASVALLANLLITVAFMVFFKATFTLPGLAGLVLMLAMAVDANVLIYERLREERDRGASLILALRNGYERALPTILDTHLTSIFTAVVLYVVGNDQLKGFGVSLTVGLIISLFTALYMTRVMFNLWQYKGWLTKLSMLRFFHKPNLDFMRVRYYWFTATVLLSILGMAVFLIRGEKGLAIDFTGGTGYHIVFKEAKPIDEVRRRLSEREVLPDVTVDALYRGEQAAGNSREFIVRTTLRKAVQDPSGRVHFVFDPEEVKRRVMDTFGDELEYVQAQAQMKELPPDNAMRWEVELTDSDPPIPADKLSGIVEEGKTPTLAQLRQADVQRIFAVTSTRVSGLVSRWFADRQVPKPDQYYTVEDRVRSETTSDGQSAWRPVVILRFRFPENLSEADPNHLVQFLTEGLSGPKSELLENFDSQVAREVQLTALQAIVLSWLAIIGYLWFRFGNWTFGVAAVLCLIHDVMFSAGLLGIASYFAELFPTISSWLLLEQFKMDLSGVAALLTLIGFSVNDTIVVFDRIREVRGKSPLLTPEMINESINQTLSRTILTSFTAFLVVFVLYVLGGPGVHLFSFLMMVGVVVGTYSSIFVASPLLLILREGQPAEPARATVGQAARP